MPTAVAVAHPNIALVKYWGKRDAGLNLPAAGSLSVTLAPMATTTRLTWGKSSDAFTLNGRAASGRDAARLSGFLDLVRALRPDLGGAEVVSENNFPTAAGLASSSSGFAALALAATHAARVELGPAALSVLARRGSGSAARSLVGGLVRMDGGRLGDGSDAFATQVDPLTDWPLQVVIAVTTEASKETSSTDGMTLTQQTSPYYPAWVAGVEPDIDEAVEAIASRDFDRLARVAEASAMRMHACALGADPAVLYWRGATVDVIHTVRALRRQAGIPCFVTVDAGPHVKVFVLPEHVDRVNRALLEVPGVLRTILARVGGDATVRIEGS